MTPRRSLAALVVVALPFAAACGAGKNNETERIRTSPYVANAAAGTMLVRGVSVIIAAGATFSPSGPAAPSPSGPAPASPGASGAQAYVVGTIVNTGTSPDVLTGAAVESGTTTPDPGGVRALTVRPQHLLTFVDPDVSGTGQTLVVSGLTSPLRLGTTVQVSFAFRDAGTVTMQAPVRDASTAGTTDTATPVYFTGNYPSPPQEVPSAAPHPASSSPTSTP